MFIIGVDVKVAKKYDGCNLHYSYIIIIIILVYIPTHGIALQLLDVAT